MTIKILKIDFRKGERGQCNTCPITRGCLRAAKPLGYTVVRVGPVRVTFFSPYDFYGVVRDLPPSARGAIRRFDSYDVVPLFYDSDPEIDGGPTTRRRVATTPKSHFDPFEFEIEDLPRVKGKVFTVPGVYAIDPKTRKATRRLRKFVAT